MHRSSDQHFVPFLLLLLLLGSIQIILLGGRLRYGLFGIVIDVSIAIPKLHFLKGL